MGHVLKKNESEIKLIKLGKYSSRHQKVARLNSGNTITVKALLRKMDKEKTSGAKSSKEK
jgi:hypothetical protein